MSRENESGRDEKGMIGAPKRIFVGPRDWSPVCEKDIKAEYIRGDIAKTLAEELRGYSRYYEDENEALRIYDEAVSEKEDE